MTIIRSATQDRPIYRGAIVRSEGTPPVVSYLTWNPLDASGEYSLTNGDLTVTKGVNSSWVSVRSLLGVQTGKVQYQLGTVYSAAPNTIFGIATASAALGNFCGADAHGYGYNLNSGLLYHSASGTAQGSAAGDGQKADAIIDLDAKTITFRINGVAQGSPVDYSALVGDVYAMLSIYDLGGALTTHFGQSAFDYPAVNYSGWAQP